MNPGLLTPHDSTSSSAVKSRRPRDGAAEARSTDDERARRLA